MIDHADDLGPDRRRRRRMVRALAGDDIADEVAAALEALPRHWFLPADSRDRAYDDTALPIACGQTISQPRVVARMASLLAVEPGQAVLDVGSGSGYAAAVLSCLAGPRGFVYAVERHEALMEQSRAALSAVDALGDTAPVLLHLADGTPGLPAHGPYDRIHVACAAEHLPTALLDQLAPGGRLVAPVGPQGADQQLLLVRRGLDGCLTDEHLGAVRFVPLIEEQP